MRLALLSNSRLANPIRAPAPQDTRGKTLGCNHYLDSSFHPSPDIFDLGKRRSSLKLASCLSKRFLRCQIDGVS